MKTRESVYAVAVKESPIDGFGVFALKQFYAGDIIGIISGTIWETLDPNCDYTCYFGIEHEDFPEREYGYYIEPTAPFRYLNHSSEPNADMSSPVLIALRQIAIGEEITIDYGEDWE